MLYKLHAFSPDWIVALAANLVAIVFTVIASIGDIELWVRLPLVICDLILAAVSIMWLRSKSRSNRQEEELRRLDIAIKKRELELLGEKNPGTGGEGANRPE